MEIKSAYSLMEIANWQLNSNNSDVQLPALQRNLVWKPEQIELLWDSIIRGFPIGSFVIEYRGSDKFLLDGQQRSNAISLGFDTSIIADKDDMDAVLWLDIEPSNADSATRKFWIEVTTKPHPWGYKNNDECSVLSANERREALKKFGLKNIYENPVSLRDTWPVEAGLPIPLSFILCNRIKNINKEDFIDDVLSDIEKLCNRIKNINKEDFIDEVLSDIEKLCERHTKYFECYGRKLKNDNIRDLIAKCYNDFSFIDQYRVGVNILDSAVTDNESSESKQDNKTDIEILFERLGVGGTRISQSELHYSTIKSYWGEELKIENEDVAKSYMPAETLISLIFRLVKTELDEKKDGFFGGLSLQNIRKMAQDEKAKQMVYSFFSPKGSSPIRNILNEIETWIVGDKSKTQDYTPTIIRTAIAREYAEIYLLLIHFAKRMKCERYDIRDTDKFFKALALHLFFFSHKLSEVVNIIYSKCYGEGNITESNIMYALNEAVYNGSLSKYVSPDKIDSWDKIEKDSKEFYQSIVSWQGKNYYMLLYAQREYINEKFKNYDPARNDLWQRHNRPWDYDHIIPKDWVEGKRSQYRENAKYWIWNIGNCCAIPFEINRAKSNSEDWNEYSNNSKQLLFDERFSDIKCDFVNSKDDVYKLGDLVLNRSVEIYRKFYDDAVVPLMRTNNSFPKDTFLYKRKAFFEEVQRKLEDAEFTPTICYVSGQLQKNVTLDSLQDWSSDWISVGVELDSHLFACICTSDSDTIEFGIRKHPNDLIIQRDYNPEALNKIEIGTGLPKYPNDEWWYFEKDVKLTVFNVDKLVELIKCVKEIIK